MVSVTKKLITFNVITMVEIVVQILKWLEIVSVMKKLIIFNVNMMTENVVDPMSHVSDLAFFME